jgi:UDP-GlcNAc:undecaprenyl-phosphate GlcNAc-1-phosphate transferase
LFVGLVGSLMLTALSRYAAPRLGLLDHPDDAHKQHGRTVAIGGWAIAGAALPIFALVNSPEIWKLALGGFVALLVGLLDDRFGLSPKAKLLGQLLCALVTVMIAGWTIKSVNLFGRELALGWLAIPFTLFWIIGAINAVNLLDGLDGLASGGAALVCGATAIIAWQSGDSFVMMLSVGFVGILLGFLLFNWAPAKVFLGDGGTHFLGYWLAVLSLHATQGALLPSILLLGVPIFDTAWAILRRIRQRRSILQADRGHVHHRLRALGLSERVTVLLLYGIITVLCAVAVVIFRT